MDRCLGVGHTHKLRLSSVNEMAKHPADTNRAFVAQAMREETLLAKLAVTARLDAGNDAVVANLQSGHRTANFGDHADAFMSKDAPRRNGRNITLQNMQISSADCGCIDPHNHISRMLNFRIWYVLPGLFAWTFVYKCLHKILPAFRLIHFGPNANTPC